MTVEVRQTHSEGGNVFVDGKFAGTLDEPMDVGFPYSLIKLEGREKPIYAAPGKRSFGGGFQRDYSSAIETIKEVLSPETAPPKPPPEPEPTAAELYDPYVDDDCPCCGQPRYLCDCNRRMSGCCSYHTPHGAS